MVIETIWPSKASIPFIAAIVLLFGAAPGIAWTAGALAILIVLVGVTLRMGQQPDSKTAPK